MKLTFTQGNTNNSRKSYRFYDPKNKKLFLSYNYFLGLKLLVVSI